jgi:hypothetical protein
MAFLDSMTAYRNPLVDLMPPQTRTMRGRSPYEVQAEVYMDGLKAQVTELEASLAANQELLMGCWHGGEQLQVISVSMPSKNVVALRCIDAEGDVTQITGHMQSITFSFRIVTAKEPVTHRSIGFETPSNEGN